MEEPLLPVSSPAADEEAAAPVHAADIAALRLPLATPSTSTVLVRLAFVVALALVSLWANHEASRGFGIAVVNVAAGSVAGRRFDLMFVSNDRASRVLLDASRSVERVLYPGGGAEAKKPVNHVTLRLADGNLSSNVSILPGGGKNDFVLHVSYQVMLAADADTALRAAVRRGMARVWLWDGRGEAPESLVDAMAEYVATSASPDSTAGRDLIGSGADAGTEGDGESSCWPVAALQLGGSGGGDAATLFVRFCEGRRRGFVARLNRAMQERWRPEMVEEALGSPPGPLRRHGEVAATVRDDRFVGAAQNGHVTFQGWASG